jgi:apolipoprotein N-acyltransferase
LATAGAAGLILNARVKPPAIPTEWEAEATSIHRRRSMDHLADFTAEERLQRIALSSTRSFVVFPESAVRLWTKATDDFWTTALSGSGKTVLVGAAQAIPGSDRYNNALVIVGEQARPAVRQRIPVPGGMWNPFRRRGGFALNLFETGAVDVGRERAAVLICYEQLLTWPVLRSALERPTLLIAISNEAWAASTVVPRVQHSCARAWARLFGLPLISAINS